MFDLKTWTIPLTAALLLPACSSGEGTIEPTESLAPTGTQAPDTEPEPTATPTEVPFPQGTALAIVSTTDYTNGALGLIDPSNFATRADLAAGTGNTVVRATGGVVFSMNRLAFSGGVDSIDARDALTLDVTGSVAVGASSNPEDMVFTEGKGYVSLYKGDGVQVFSLDDYSATTTIDLSAYADDDGFAEAADLLVYDGKVYVSLQRIDYNTFTPATPGYVVEIDPSTDEVTRAFELTGTGASTLWADGDTLYVCSGGAYNDGLGGIETVDLESGTTQGFLLTEASVGVDLFGFTAWGGQGYLTVGGALKRFNLTTGEVTDGPTAASGIYVSGVWPDAYGRLWLSDGAGITVIDPGADTVVSGGAVGVGAYGPYSLTFADLN